MASAVLLSLVFWTAMSQPDLISRIRCNSLAQDAFCGSIENYTMFATPNFRNGTEEDEIDSELATYIILYSTGCSNALVHLLCAYYKPFCFSPAPAVSIRLPPCRELCLYVRSTCEPALMGLEARARWPDHLDCNQFPLEGVDSSSPCFPSFNTLEQYRNDLELPAIPGAPLPSRITQGDTIDEVTEISRPPEVPVSCPKVLRPGNMSGDYLQYQLAEETACGVPCDKNYHTEADLAVPIIVVVLSIVGMAATLFVIATFLIDRDRFHYPERPIVYLAVCYLVICIMFLIGSSSKLASASVACSPPSASSVSFVFQRLPQSNFQSLSARSGGCVVVFVFLYFAVMASLVWWDILTFTWFLAAALKWAEEAIGKFWILYHFLAWGIPFVQAIIAMAVQLVDGDQLSGVCYIGNSNNTGLGVFVFFPLVLYLAVGMVFLVIGLIALFQIHRQLARDRTKSQRLSRLIFRVGLFSALYCIPNLILVLVYVYELAMKLQWHRAILCTEGADTVDCSSVGSPTSGYPALVIKYLVWLIVACSISVWVFSWKTVLAWKKLIWDLTPFLKRESEKSLEDVKKASSASRI